MVCVPLVCIVILMATGARVALRRRKRDLALSIRRGELRKQLSHVPSGPCALYEELLARYENEKGTKPSAEDLVTASTYLHEFAKNRGQILNWEIIRQCSLEQKDKRQGQGTEVHLLEQSSAEGSQRSESQTAWVLHEEAEDDGFGNATVKRNVSQVAGPEITMLGRNSTSPLSSGGDDGLDNATMKRNVSQAAEAEITTLKQNSTTPMSPGAYPAENTLSFEDFQRFAEDMRCDISQYPGALQRIFSSMSTDQQGVSEREVNTALSNKSHPNAFFLADLFNEFKAGYSEQCVDLCGKLDAFLYMPHVISRSINATTWQSDPNVKHLVDEISQASCWSRCWRIMVPRAIANPPGKITWNLGYTLYEKSLHVHDEVESLTLGYTGIVTSLEGTTSVEVQPIRMWMNVANFLPVCDVSFDCGPSPCLYCSGPSTWSFVREQCCTVDVYGDYCRKTYPHWMQRCHGQGVQVGDRLRDGIYFSTIRQVPTPAYPFLTYQRDGAAFLSQMNTSQNTNWREVFKVVSTMARVHQVGDIVGGLQFGGFVGKIKAINSKGELQVWFHRVNMVQVSSTELLKVGGSPLQDERKDTSFNYQWEYSSKDKPQNMRPYDSIRNEMVEGGHNYYNIFRQAWQDHWIRRILSRAPSVESPWLIYLVGSITIGKVNVMSYLTERGYFGLERTVYINPAYFKAVIPEHDPYRAWRALDKNMIEDTMIQTESITIQETTFWCALSESKNIVVDASHPDTKWLIEDHVIEGIKTMYPNRYRIAVLHGVNAEDRNAQLYKPMGNSSSRSPVDFLARINIPVLSGTMDNTASSHAHGYRHHHGHANAHGRTNAPNQVSELDEPVGDWMLLKQHFGPDELTKLRQRKEGGEQVEQLDGPTWDDLVQSTKWEKMDGEYPGGALAYEDFHVSAFVPRAKKECLKRPACVGFVYYSDFRLLAYPAFHTLNISAVYYRFGMVGVKYVGMARQMTNSRLLGGDPQGGQCTSYLKSSAGPTVTK